MAKTRYKSRFAPLPPAEMAAMQRDVDPQTAYQDALSAIKDGIPQAGTDRWLWMNGVASEGIKINLINFGYMSHPKVSKVEVAFPEVVDADGPPFIIFKVWLPKKDVRRYLKNQKKIKWLSARKLLLFRWLLMRTLERTEMIDIGRNIRRGVREYLGQSVPVTIDVLVEVEA